MTLLWFEKKLSPAGIWGRLKFDIDVFTLIDTFTQWCESEAIKAEENGMYSALRILPSLLKNIVHNALFLLILTSKSKQNELIQACIRSKCRGLELIDIYISI